MRTALLVVTVAAILGWATALGWVRWRDTWTGHVYPDREDNMRHWFVGTFGEHDGCEWAARELKREWSLDDRAGYECSRNCRPLHPSLGEGLSVHVCEEAGQRLPF